MRQSVPRLAGLLRLVPSAMRNGRPGQTVFAVACCTGAGHGLKKSARTVQALDQRFISEVRNASSPAQAATRCSE